MEKIDLRFLHVSLLFCTSSFFLHFCISNSLMLQVNNISFGYSDKSTIKEVFLTLEKGACLAVVGESGCGKSTLLRLIYGLHDLDEGSIYWNGQQVLGPSFHLIPGMDTMKFLAQDFDLMPYITVAENVGKFLSNINLNYKKARIAELLELVEMIEFAHVKAKNLSGGQMQRVAIARVLALEPELLLLDEPFSHIDTFRKNSLRRKVFQYLREKNISCIVASHDTTDILGFTDHILVLQDGITVALGPTRSVYESLTNRYVAALFDEVNVLPEYLFHPGDQGKERLLYPNQLQIVDHSDLVVVVTRSYYKGHAFLIEAACEDRTVFFYNAVDLAPNTRLNLGLRS